MTDIVDRYIIKGDADDGKRALKDFAAAVDKSFGKSAKSAVLFNKALNLGEAALRKTFAEMQRGIKLALEYDRTNVKLAASLRSLRGEGEFSVRMLNDQASQLQRVSGISDDVIRDFQAMGIQLGLATDEVDKYIRAAISMSNVTGADMRTSFNQVVKTLTGLKEETIKLIPQVDALSAAELRAGKAVDAINEAYGSLVGVGTQGVSGSVVQLTNDWDDFVEQMGRVITESETFASAVETLSEAIRGMTRALEDGSFLDGLDKLTRIVFGGVMTGGVMTGPSRSMLLRAQKRAERREFESDMSDIDAMAALGMGPNAPATRSRTSIKRPGGGKKKDKFTESDAIVAQQEGLAIIQDVMAQEDAARERMAQKQLERDEMMAEVRLNNEIRVSQKKQEMWDAQLAADESAGEEMAMRQLERTEIVAGSLQAIGDAALGSITSSLQQMAAEGEFSAERLAGALISAVGNALIADGVANVAKAAAMAFIPGQQGFAGGLAAAGAAEIALGTAVAAAGGSINRDLPSFGGGPSINERRARRNERFASGNAPGGRRSGQGPGGGGDRTVTIVVPNVLAAEEAGYRVASALRDANRYGLT